MTYKELLLRGEELLKQSNINEYSLDAYLLFEDVFSISRATYFVKCNDIIENESRISEYLEKIKRRSERIPLQHITNSQEFMGLNFYVDENVLCPRQDTECLVEETLKAIEVLKKSNESKKTKTIDALDMCTGSGCIAISLKKISADISHMTAVDLSTKALQIAKKNAIDNNVDIEFINSDLFESLNEGKDIGGKIYDIIVSNPPYIKTEEIYNLMSEVKDHEPMMALDGYEDGLYFYREITKASVAYIKENGWLLYEIGYDQGEAVKAIMLDNGFDDIEIIKDLAGLDRVVKGRKTGGKQ